MLAGPFHRTFTVDRKVLDPVEQVVRVVQANIAHRDLHRSVDHRVDS
jgi:hypothetical protein